MNKRFAVRVLIMVFGVALFMFGALPLTAISVYPDLWIWVNFGILGCLCVYSGLILIFALLEDYIANGFVKKKEDTIAAINEPITK